MSTICPNCGDEFDNVGTHWRHNGYPEIDQYRDSLLGMALGDGSFDRSRGNSRLGFIMTNKQFLDWYRDELDWLATDVRVHRTPDKLATTGRGSDDPDAYRTQYVLRTRNHPQIREWHDWLMSNGKQIPEEMTLSWEMLRYWYICDGHYEIQTNGVNPRIVIGATNYMNQKERVRDLFEDLGLDARVSSDVIRLGVDEAATFFENTEPIPGFRHKWPESQGT